MLAFEATTGLVSHALWDVATIAWEEGTITRLGHVTHAYVWSRN